MDAEITQTQIDSGNPQIRVYYGIADNDDQAPELLHTTGATTWGATTSRTESWGSFVGYRKLAS